jgi:hypothetical protein
VQTGRGGRAVALSARFTNVRIDVVASTSKNAWNTLLDTRKQSALMKSVDAITMHHYGPNPTQIATLPAEQQRTALAADGELISASMAAIAHSIFINEGHTHLSLWRTEYNHSGSWVGPLLALYEPAGGMHALFMAGHVLAALEHQPWTVPFGVLMLHCLAHQPSAGWSSSNATLRIVGDNADDPAAAVAQVFAHLADSVLATHGSIALATHGNTSCTQATVFAGSVGQTENLMAFVLMNRCETAVAVDITTGTTPVDHAGVRASTTYVAGDKGGWFPLPSTGSKVPWSSPLTPSPLSTGACSGSQGCVLPPVSLTFVKVGSSFK